MTSINAALDPLERKRGNRDSTAGFSLIEILVSILLVTVLLALAFPIAETVRSKAQSSVCVSNLRQLGEGIQLYAGENNGFLPPARDLYETPQYKVVAWYNDPSMWPYKYLSNTWPNGLKIFACPSDKTPNKSPRYISYSCNFYYLQDWDAGKPRAQGGYIPIGKSANKIIMLDGASLAEGCTLASSSRVPEVFLYENMNTVISERHDNGANCLLGSGAVKWMRKSEIVTSPLIN